MASIAYKVEMGGDADRSPFGECHGSMRISHVGQSEAIQLSYHGGRDGTGPIQS